MMILVYSKSESFKQHIGQVLGGQVSYRADLKVPHAGQSGILLIHLSSFTKENVQSFLNDNKALLERIAIADDLPDVGKMLRYTRIGVRAYCNAYMAKPHFEQLQLMLEGGGSWYPPALLSQALDLAHASIRTEEKDDQLDGLTPRQKQIALSIAEGKSNKSVADEHGISERTVKSHLTQIFEKLDVDDRVGLVLHLKQSKVTGKV